MSICVPHRWQRIWRSPSLIIAILTHIPGCSMIRAVPGPELDGECGGSAVSKCDSRPAAAAPGRYDRAVIPAIVLAAGKSTRMGSPKAMLALGGGDTFLSRIIRTFHDAGVNDVIVVVGHQAEAIRASLAATGVTARFVDNPAYESGQFSSLVAGLDAADRPDVAAVLVTLVDVPLVTAATIDAVLEHFRRSHAPIVRPTRGTEHGHPVLIAQSLFAELRRADPSSGAKPVVRAHASAAGDIAIADAGAFLDIDTMDEYRRAVGVI
jgi:molybdenum cofactor cytidylyltransferase